MALIRGAGTKVFLTRDGEVKIMGSSTDYKPEEGEQELKYLKAVDIRMRPDELVTAELSVRVSEVRVEGKPKMALTHPQTGKKKVIKSITFEDGSTEIWPILPNAT